MPKRKPGTYRTNKDSVAKLEQRDRIIELRIKGYSYPAIAKELKLSTVRPYQIVQEYVKEYREKHAEQIEHMVEIELQRLDLLTTKLWSAFEAGEIAAAGLLLRTSERRAKMLGFDSQEKGELQIQIKGYRGFSPDEWPEQVKE
jgi:hypothetical protein